MPKPFLTGIDLRNQKAVNVADGTAPTDAVNLQQLQASMRGASWKPTVRAASTTNTSLTTPGASMDGVTLATGDRVLLKNQTAPAENGIYVWTGASSALTRALDADSAAELAGATVLVTEGTTNADKAFTQTADGITLGSTGLVWAQFGGSSAYTAGAGLTLSGSQFAVVPGAGIIADGTSTRLDPAVAVRKYASDIGDGTSTSIAKAHGLGTADLTYSLRDKTSGLVVDTDVVMDATNITLTFAAAPSSAQYRLTVHG